MIPVERILPFPYPGMATAKEVLYLDDHYGVICELVDGVLVRKAIRAVESLLAMYIGSLLGNHADKHDLGVVLGEAGFLELAAGQVRAPDVSFLSWQRLPGGEFPKKRIPHLVPDIAVEVINESNTPKEMLRKRREYFAQGTPLVWEVYLTTKSVDVFTSVEESKTLSVGQSLDGGPVLPGFKLSLKKLFAPRRKRG
jgi:Uma2 family endonuclease